MIVCFFSKCVSDKNECDCHDDNCDRTTTICVNTEGSYRCDPCPHGYEPVSYVCTGMYTVNLHLLNTRH